MGPEHKINDINRGDRRENYTGGTRPGEHVQDTWLSHWLRKCEVIRAGASGEGRGGNTH